VIKWILKLVKPFVIWLGHQRLKLKVSKFDVLDLAQLRMHIKPGDILLTTTWGESSNLLNWGTWKHALMYIGDDTIIEAVGEGVIENTLEKVTVGKYRVLALTSKVHTRLEVHDAIENMKGRLGRSYDYDFNPDNDSDYCSESIWFSYMDSNPQIKLKRQVLAGLHIVKPNHFKEDKDVWQIVYRK